VNQQQLRCSSGTGASASLACEHTAVVLLLSSKPELQYVWVWQWGANAVEQSGLKWFSLGVAVGSKCRGAIWLEVVQLLLQLHFCCQGLRQHVGRPCSIDSIFC
jgi:hypothetical protein